MNLAEVKARHEARELVLAGLTRAADRHGIHQDRGWLIEQLEAIKPLVKELYVANGCHDCRPVYDTIDKLEAVLK